MHKQMNATNALSLTLLLTLAGSASTARAAEHTNMTSPKRVLVVSVTAGFRHTCIPVGNQVFADLARRSGAFTVDFIEQPSGSAPKQPRPPAPLAADASDAAKADYAAKKAEYDSALATYQTDLAQWTDSLAQALKPLSPENLKKYDAVVFNNTTGDLPLPDKAGFLQWIADGHGFVGVHAATDTFRGHTPLDPFVEMIGGEFKSHPPGTYDVECQIMDLEFPATKHLGQTWKLNDEIYLLNGFNRSKVHLLMSLDKHPKDKTPGFFPLAWSKQYGKGRVFYTALGHREDVWSGEWKDKDGKRLNPPEVAEAYQQQVLGGLLWALGLAEGSAAPQTQAP